MSHGAWTSSWTSAVRTDRPFRHADDEDMNNEMRQEERWNDPAAAFLSVRCHSSRVY